MGKGGLSFLNKKSWHTATIANAEKVWLAEQKDAAEKAKLAQLQKEIAEERQVEELRALQRQHGTGQKPVERLDWMYRSAEIEAEIKQKEKEEFLLGKPIPASQLAPEPKKPAGVEAISASSTERWVKKYEQRDLDAESRIREDPMLLILKQEQEQRLSILKNPLQMKRIREEVDKKKLLKKLKKMEKEEKKKEKKKHKKEKEKPKSPSRSRSPSPEPARSYVDKYGLIQPRAPRPDDHRRDSHDDGRESRRSKDEDRHSRHRSRSPRRSGDHDRYSHRDRSRHDRERRRSRSPREHHRVRSRSTSRQRRDSVHHDLSRDRRRRYDDEERRSRRRSRSGSSDRRHRRTSPSRRSRSRSPEPEPKAVDPNEAQKLRLQALKSRIGNRLQRTRDVASSLTTKLTPQEREAKLKAMMNDAQDQHELRAKQLELDIEAQKREEEALRLRGSEAGDNAEFIQKLKKQAFMESGDNIEDRIKQRVHYRQKGNTEYHSFL